MVKATILNFDRIMMILNEHKEELKEKFGIREIGIFGSFARGEQREKSDVDVLVEFEKPIDFFTYLDLKDEIERLLGKKLDLVMKKTLKPKIGERILQEVIYV